MNEILWEIDAPNRIIMNKRKIVFIKSLFSFESHSLFQSVVEMYRLLFNFQALKNKFGFIALAREEKPFPKNGCILNGKFFLKMDASQFFAYSPFITQVQLC